jgi:iron(III) transport system substrate-binding protein
VTGHDLWLRGFDAQFLDAQGSLHFGWEHQVFHAYAVDSTVVGAGEIQTVNDLLNPKWRGKILSLDPRSGPGLLSAASVARARGMDVVRQLLVDQQPTFVRTGPREVTESLARGRFAIALGVRPKALKHLQDQGIGQQIQYLDLPDADFVQPMVLAHVANAPHPAAARLFANWMLTQEAQTTLTGGLQTNSARTDVPTFAADGAGTPGVAHFHPDRDEHVQHVAETRRLVQQLLA